MKKPPCTCEEQKPWQTGMQLVQHVTHHPFYQHQCGTLLTR